MNLLSDYLTASLFTMEEDVCSIIAIVVSVRRGSDICQRQKGWEDVHSTAGGDQ